MRRTRVNDALNSQAPREQILVKGWVRTRRDAKGVSFLELNDGSSLHNLQAVIAESALAGGSLIGVSTGAAVEVEGALVESPGKGQRWEVQATQVRLVGAADPETYPLQKKRHTMNFCAALPISVRAPINMAPFSASAQKVPLRYTPFSALAGSTICTPPSLPGRTAKVPAPCFASLPCLLG
jgi:aspartyl/asparaginyl-tRNA synthetase